MKDNSLKGKQEHFLKFLGGGGPSPVSAKGFEQSQYDVRASLSERMTMSIKDESQIKDQIRKSEVPFEGLNTKANFDTLVKTYDGINACVESLRAKINEMASHTLAREEIEKISDQLLSLLSSQFSSIRPDNLPQTTANLKEIHAKMQMAYQKIDEHQQIQRHRLCRQAAHLIFKKRSLSCSFAPIANVPAGQIADSVLKDSKLQVVERQVEGGDSDSDLGNGRSAGVQVNMFAPHKGDVATNLQDFLINGGDPKVGPLATSLTNRKLKDTETKKDEELFKEIEMLMAEHDDIEMETERAFMLNDITEFLDRVEMSAEEMLFHQIASDDPQYVPIEKENFLEDVKRFLYYYCTSGDFYRRGSGASSPANPSPENKLKVLKIIHKFKKQIVHLQEEQKILKQKSINEIQNRQALQKQAQNQMKHDFSRQTIESSPQVNPLPQKSGFQELQSTIEGRVFKEASKSNLLPCVNESDSANSGGQSGPGSGGDIMLSGDKDTQTAVANRLSKLPRISEFIPKAEPTLNLNEEPQAPWDSHSSIQELEVQISQGKLLIKHLLQVFKQRFQGQEAPPGRVLVAQYKDILFNLVVSRKEFSTIESISDFVGVIERNYRKVIDIEDSDMVDIIFVERVAAGDGFIIHSRDRFGFDLEGKTLLVFLIQTKAEAKKEISIQTENLPPFEYKFDSTQLKKLPGVCKICNEQMLITDEYIRLLDCNHVFHRICLIHQIAELTSKLFFLTRQEQKQVPNQPLSLCPTCKAEDSEVGYLSKGFCKGYRKHIIFDLLKDKADPFYQQMLERQLQEERNPDEDGLSQDSENYNEDYKNMVKNQLEQQDIAQTLQNQQLDLTRRDEFEAQVATNTSQSNEMDFVQSPREGGRGESYTDSAKEGAPHQEPPVDAVMEGSDLIVIPNSVCSVCNQEKENCIILSTHCRHQACIDCIETKITLPVQQKLETRQKISVDMVSCKASEWCEQIMPLTILLPLLNLSELDHREDILKVQEMYEDSLCCIGEGNLQFVDQVKWMAHCLICLGKFCVVCVGADQNLGPAGQSQRPTLAQCQCVRCPECDSANTVNREQTKSYYCHICAKYFCWLCHQSIFACQCFPGKSKSKKKLPSDPETMLELREKNIINYNKRANQEDDDFRRRGKLSHPDYEEERPQRTHRSKKQRQRAQSSHPSTRSRHKPKAPAHDRFHSDDEGEGTNFEPRIRSNIQRRKFKRSQKQPSTTKAASSGFLGGLFSVFGGK